jgi:hypothetical protein
MCEDLAAAAAVNRHRNVQEAYEFIASHPFPDFHVNKYQRVRGTVDLHVHVGAARQEPVALMQLASRAGMRALVFKSGPLKSTAILAASMNLYAKEWAHEHGYEATEAIGGTILSQLSRNAWADYAAREADAGSRVIWFPVADAANHLIVAHSYDAQTAAAQGLTVLDGDNLTTEADEVLHVVRERRLGVSFGHLSRTEIFALANRCTELGITQAFVDHPFNPVAGLTVADMVELGKQGVTMNFTNFELSPYCGVSAGEIAAAIRSIGRSVVTFSSDSGLDIMPSAVECSRLHTALLSLYGFSDDDMNQICRVNQLRILGVVEPSVA